MAAVPNAGEAIGRVPDDDPAELYHEASKLEPALAALQLADLRRFASEPALRAAASRPVRRHPFRPTVSLPFPAWPAVPLREAVHARRSTADLGGGEVTLDDLSLVLAGACGRTGEILGPSGDLVPGRAAPSGGGLYPLDLVVLPLRCPALAEAGHRYDPERHALQPLGRPLPADALADIVYQPEIAATAGAFVAVVATFARSRVKYGLRAYRFVLLEAGHVVQGALLAAAAGDLRALPVGGLVDRRLERLLALDGVRESVVHAFALGRAEAGR